MSQVTVHGAPGSGAGPATTAGASTRRPRRRGAAARAADAARWDRFVETAPGGDLVQTSAWAASKRAVGQDSRLVVLEDGGGEVLGGAQIVLTRLAPGLAVGYCPRGPLVREGAAGHADLVVERVLEAGRAAGLRLIIVQPPEGAESLERALARRGFEAGCPSVAPEATIRLDLRASDAELLAGMTPMRRRNIRRGGTDGLVIAPDDDVEAFARLHAATAARQGFAPLDPAALRAQWDALAPSGRCVLVLARQRGIPVAGAWLTSFAGTVTFKLAGWDADAAARAGARSNVNALVQWESIRLARSLGARTYDLGGFDRAAAETLRGGGRLPDDFRSTPGFFKLGFGGEPVLFPVPRWAALGGGAAIVRPAARRVLASRRIVPSLTRLRSGSRAR